MAGEWRSDCCVATWPSRTGNEMNHLLRAQATAIAWCCLATGCSTTMEANERVVQRIGADDTAKSLGIEQYEVSQSEQLEISLLAADDTVKGVLVFDSNRYDGEYTSVEIQGQPLVEILANPYQTTFTIDGVEQGRVSRSENGELVVDGSLELDAIASQLEFVTVVRSDAGLSEFLTTDDMGLLPYLSSSQCAYACGACLIGVGGLIDWCEQGKPTYGDGSGLAWLYGTIYSCDTCVGACGAPRSPQLEAELQNACGW